MWLPRSHDHCCRPQTIQHSASRRHIRVGQRACA
ncbi:hypothetical protein PMIN01_03228 [Paraphaeosphaeria minitans]|uniref:Uncharacterized protein n=1 Tax=Paraphaeosphaeria minitans TaxID=565426 RepID=A0A9P6GP36_9PLEO|nr:hypothetical protein PMIN01_03228 [Paraphaeosphaeria minitans]